MFWFWVVIILLFVMSIWTPVLTVLGILSGIGAVVVLIAAINSIRDGEVFGGIFLCLLAVLVGCVAVFFFAIA